jgi:hypothetical protein
VRGSSKALLVLTLLLAAAAILGFGQWWLRQNESSTAADIPTLESYPPEAAAWLKRLVAVKLNEQLLTTRAEREAFRGLIDDPALTTGQSATLLFWSIIRRINIRDESLNRVLHDDQFIAHASHEWLFTLGRMSYFRAHPYAPQRYTNEYLLRGTELCNLARQAEPSVALYHLYCASALHYMRLDARRDDDAERSSTLLSRIVSVVQDFIAAEETGTLMPPPYLEFYHSESDLPAGLKHGDNARLAWGPGMHYALLVGADLKDYIREDPSPERLALLLRFYRQLLSIEPPVADTFDVTVLDMVQYLREELPQVMPDTAEAVDLSTRQLAELSDSLQDVVGYSEANPIFFFTDMGRYEEERRLAYRGSLRLEIDTILRQLGE